MTEQLRLAEVLAALSLTTDLGAGVPFEKGLRTCVMAAAIAELLNLDPSERRAVYFAALLRSLGCTAHAGSDRGQELIVRFRRELPAQGQQLSRGSCEVSAALGTRLGLPAGAIDALDEVYERYDGRGLPSGRSGDQLTLAARIVHLAEQAVLADYDGGPEAARRSVLRRAAGHLDPHLCAVFAEHSAELFDALSAPDMLGAVLESEPPPVASVPPEASERVCLAFATFADLKGRFLLGHSSHTAQLAGAAAELAGGGTAAARQLRISALVMDIGRVGVSSATWDRAGRLGAVEWERVRLHAYWTERILKRCPALECLAPMASAHHERLDGSGYHRAARANQLSSGERILAVADAFAAMTEGRPHRAARSAGEAAGAFTAEVAGGRMDAEAVSAVVEAAGLPRQRIPWPNDLTDREVHVLRVLARGLSNREIAESLVLSPRTVQHHLANVYDKIGRRTRAGAAVFAIEHGLVPGHNEA